MSASQPQGPPSPDLLGILEDRDTYSGYNSGDEHLVPKETLLTPDEWKHRDEQFIKAMSERGFIIQDIVEDGACLFRAISLQIYGDQEMHEVIRQQTMDYIVRTRITYLHSAIIYKTNPPSLTVPESGVFCAFRDGRHKQLCEKKTQQGIARKSH